MNEAEEWVQEESDRELRKHYDEMLSLADELYDYDEEFTLSWYRLRS